MARPRHIIAKTQHRPWPLPAGQWQYYQEWNQALFLHWEVPFNLLRPLVPSSLVLDNFNGKYFISLVPFMMQRVKPQILPSWSVVSDFYEINVRTYVEHNGKKGVYFLSIECQKALSAFFARNFSGLPYHKANIHYQHQRWISHNPQKGFKLDVSFVPGAKILGKSALDIWFTERYCLYHFIQGRTWIFEVHHEEWDLYDVEVNIETLHYPVGKIEPRPLQIYSTHFSPGVQVLTWPRKPV